MDYHAHLNMYTWLTDATEATDYNTTILHNLVEESPRVVCFIVSSDMVWAKRLIVL